MGSDQELSVVEARPVTPDQAISRSGSPDFVSSIPPQTRQDTAHLTPYSRPPEYGHREDTIDATQHDPSCSAEDLRVSSSHSLLPDEDAIDGRRKLLLIYIHGFMGAEISFQSFPAHVHRIVTDSLSETHVVHSKIYPRYKSRGNMTVARDAFSYWLSPHESENTDVILLGHSLGGILATEVALLPSSWSGSTEMFQHRILGVINFDVPFLGMHPGVVSAGLGSLFRPKAKSPEPQSGNSSAPEGITDTLAASSLHDHPSSSSSSIPTDSNFDAPFPNDVRFKERGQLDGALHFIMKHSDRLARATKEYVTSHLEFGGCLADYPELKDRYRRIRALEDVDEYARKTDPHDRPLRRIRFVNYYTASTGYIKPVSAANNKQNGTSNVRSTTTTTSEERTTTSSSTSRQTVSQSSSTISSIEPRPDFNPADSPPDYETSQAYHQLSIDSNLLQETSEQQTSTSPEEAKAGNKPEAAPGNLSPQTTTSSTPVSESFSSLPPLPSLPEEPAAFDPSQYADKDTLKLAQKEHSRQMKTYERAKKDREKAMKDREKLIKKREKAAAKEAAKDGSSQRQVTQKAESITIEETAVQTPPPLPPRKSSTSITTTSVASSSRYEDPDTKADVRYKGPPLPPRQNEAQKPKKDRKFCTLPSKGPDGTRDPLWVRVFMEGIDEVAAHQSLFIPNNDYYEKLVGDTAARIQEWVQEAQTTRMVLSEINALD